MTPLWLAALALLLVALGLLVPPLLSGPGRRDVGAPDALRRAYGEQLAQLDAELQGAALDAKEHAEAADELRRRLLEDSAPHGPHRPARASPWTGWVTACVLSAVLPAAALALYLQVGDPRAAAMLAAAAPAPGHAEGGADAEALVSRLALRLRSEPADLEGWVVLARSYEALQRFDDAVAAYRKALVLAPGHARLRADYADALASARGGELDADVRAELDAALALDADEPKALALAGTAALRRGEVGLARRHFERLKTLLPPGSEAALQTDADLAGLQSPPPGTPAGAVPVRVAGTVSIAAPLRARAAPDDTVFVVARAAEAGRMPVAVLRLRVAELPARFVLDDRQALSPERPLSGFPSVSLEVRVTRAADASRRPGDLLGRLDGVRLGRDDVVLVADDMVR
jgi:cytochrome c-type biogenesis protein CcmH